MRHFLSIQQPLEEGDLDCAFWQPGPENSPDGLTEVRSDMVPRQRHLGYGRCNPGSLRPLKGVAWKEGVGAVANMRTDGFWGATCCFAD